MKSTTVFVLLFSVVVGALSVVGEAVFDWLDGTPAPLHTYGMMFVFVTVLLSVIFGLLCRSLRQIATLLWLDIISELSRKREKTPRED